MIACDPTSRESFSAQLISSHKRCPDAGNGCANEMDQIAWRSSADCSTPRPSTRTVDFSSEVILFVPAFAFAWWLASLQPTRAPVVSPQPSPDGAEDEQAAGGDRLPVAEPPQSVATSGPWNGHRMKPKVLTPGIVRAAYSFLDLPMGDERFLEIDGKRYVFRLEHHYHPPGFVGGPNGWHKGVTVYEIAP